MTDSSTAPVTDADREAAEKAAAEKAAAEKEAAEKEAAEREAAEKDATIKKAIAKAKKLTIELPVSVSDAVGELKAPGTPVTLDADEARRLIERFSGKIVGTDKKA